MRLKNVTYIKLGGKEVSRITTKDGVVLWEKKSEWTGLTLTNTSSSDGNFEVVVGSSATYIPNLEYSLDGGYTWTTATLTAGTTTSVPVSAGNSIYLRGKNTSGFNNSDSYNYNTHLNMNVEHTASGNVMSIIDYDNYKTMTNVPAYGLSCLFYNDTSLTSAPELPATTLANYCYSSMFNGCTGLTSAPELPATKLANYCYQSMFNGCTGLTSAPELPATTLAFSCYYYMFNGCTGLTSAPELPATTLVSSCYEGMFRGCTGLTSAPSLPATTLASYCYSYMFRGCTGLTSAPELPATTLANYCYLGMFNGCTGLTSAPSLPATTLATSCYEGMFRGCTGLTSAPELPATTMATNCYDEMFLNCTSLNYVKHNITSWTTSNADNWLSGVASTGTMVCPSDSTIPTDSVSGIPTGWTRKAPDVEIDINENFNLTNTSSSTGTLSIYNSYSGIYAKTLSFEYSTNNSTWTTISISSDSTSTLSVPSGGKMYFRGTNTEGLGLGSSIHTSFKFDKSFTLSGNMLSLVDYSNMATLKEIPEACFYGLFDSNTTLTSVNKVNFGVATNTNDFGLYMLFSGCTSLTDTCYLDNFTTVGNSGLSEVFYNTGITTPPSIKNVVNVGVSGLQQMVYLCTSLTNGISFNTSISIGEKGLRSLYSGCSNLATIYVPNVTSWNTNNEFDTWVYNAGTSATNPIMYAPSTTVKNLIPSGTSGYGNYTVQVLS